MADVLEEAINEIIEKLGGKERLQELAGIPHPKKKALREALEKKATVPDKCECGAHKALGVQRYMPGHSDWCPWHPKQ